MVGGGGGLGDMELVSSTLIDSQSRHRPLIYRLNNSYLLCRENVSSCFLFVTLTSPHLPSPPSPHLTALTFILWTFHIGGSQLVSEQAGLVS